MNYFSCHSREGGNPAFKKMDPRVALRLPEDDNIYEVRG